MNITVTDTEGVSIVHFEGSLDTNTAAEAQDRLAAVIGEGAHEVLVDFEKIDYISRAGLRVILATDKKRRATSGTLRMCNLNEMVTDVFKISGFDTILPVYASSAEALEGF